jgi:hypothetical protein
MEDGDALTHFGGTTGTLMGIQWDWKGGFEITCFLSTFLCSLMGCPKCCWSSQRDGKRGYRLSPWCSRVSLTLVPLKGSTEGGYSVTGLKGSLSDAHWIDLQSQTIKKDQATIKTRYCGHLYSLLLCKWTHLDQPDRVFYCKGRGPILETIGSLYRDLVKV